MLAGAARRAGLQRLLERANVGLDAIDAIAEARLDGTIAVVISNRADAVGLDRARAAGIETLVIDHRAFPSRDEFDRALASQLAARRVSLVCLAGFMRLVGAPLLDAFPNAILNVHPSLLPAFPGVDAQLWETIA